MTQTSTARQRRALTAAAAVLVALAFGAAAGGDAYARQASCQKLASGQAASALPNGSASNSWRAEFEARFQKKAADDFAVPVQIQSPKGSVNDWQFLISEDRAYLNWEDSSGSYVDILNSNAAVVDGRWHSFSADVAQKGADVTVTLTVNGSTYGPSTLSGKVLDSSNSTVTINPLKGNSADAVRHFKWQASGACAELS